MASLIYSTRKARWLAYQYAYSWVYLGNAPLTADHLGRVYKLKPESVLFYNSILDKLSLNRQVIADQIDKQLVAWKQESLDPLLDAVLAVGYVEMMHLAKPNVKIIINEAVEFLKNHGQLKSAKMANAVLNNIWHKQAATSN